MPPEIAPGKRTSRAAGRAVALLAPTRLEYLAARQACRAPVVHAGVGLARWRPTEEGVVIVCGLAGALTSDLPPGTVVVPEQVALPDGQRRRCDPELTAALAAAARALGYEPDLRSLLTAPEFVTESERARWAQQGFAAVDMETGFVPVEWRVATVRVILDTPARPISASWLTPGRAMLHASAWRELLWLTRAGPSYALRAARVAAAALE